MIEQLSKEEIESQRRSEMDRIAINFKNRQEDRKLELEKVKVEFKTVNRWRGITKIFFAIFVLPLWTLCVFILILSGKEVPEYYLLTRLL